MDRKVLDKIIKNTPITQEELFSFIYDYVKDVKGVEATTSQMTGIMTALNMNLFSLTPAAEYYTKKLGLQVNRVFSKEGILLRTDIIDGN